MSCFFSLLVLSLLVSPLSSSRVSSLIFHLLLSPFSSSLFFFSCLVSSSLFLSFLFSLLVLSRLLFLCLLSLSLFLSVSLCLCLCLSPCGVVCCGVWCVWCPRVYVQKRLRVYVQNVPVCTGTTPACVTTCGRGAGTHGDVLNLHKEGFFCTYTRGRGERGAGGHRQFCLPEFAHVWLSRASEVHQRNPWIFTNFKFENRLRTTRSQVLQSFASPDEPVHFQQS